MSAAGHKEAPASLLEVIAKHVGTDLATLARQQDDGLGTLGLDSMGAVGLADQLCTDFGIETHPDELFTTSVSVLAVHLPESSLPREPHGDNRPKSSIRPGIQDAVQSSAQPAARPATTTSVVTSQAPLVPDAAGADSSALFKLTNHVDLLSQSNLVYPPAAKTYGFHDYWEAVAPLQSDLVVAYVTEAFEALGCDLSEHPHGVEVPAVPHLPKYDRLVNRLWDLLERRYIVLQRKGKILRGSDSITVAKSGELIQQLRTEHPQYECEARLLELVGPDLADCLSGKVDPIKVLFGSVESRHIMERFYSTSPMMSAHMEQLVHFFQSAIRNAPRDSTINVLEVGAGTGGTTARLLEVITNLAATDNASTVQYMFTDIGPSFVSKAKLRWKEHDFLSFSTFDIEQEPPSSFQGQYDMVLGANVVHATTDRTATCRRLRDTLKPHGILVLSEVTAEIDWYDICFGLLDGW